MSVIPSRRRFLISAATVLPAVVWPGLVQATAALPRRLTFLHTHTSERLDVVYSEHGQYIPDALAEINHLLRDFRTGDVHEIDPGLLDILHSVKEMTGGRGRYEIISGYRSPATNQMLASRSNGVADHSLHLKGQAIDVRLPGVATSNLRRAGLALKAGGVGYYPGSDFVHLDTGRVRHW
jgi:uncharacterized protein YcbK (DUF882 family)